MFTAGQSEAGREMGAKLTDCQFTVAMTKEEAVKLYADIKSRMPKYGRTPDMLKIFPCVTVSGGRTAEEADELYQRAVDLIAPNVGVGYIQKKMNIDRKRVVSGTRVCVRVDFGGRRTRKKKNYNAQLIDIIKL